MDNQIQLRCLDCDKILLNIIIFKNMDKKTILQACCPFCGGLSNLQNITGRYYVSGITSEESRSTTLIHDMKCEDDKITILMKKGK